MIGRIRSQLTLAFFVVASVAIAPAFAAGGLSFDDAADAAAIGQGSDDETPHWFTLEYEDQNGAPTFALLYGIPETDSVLFSTSCAIGGAAKSVKVELMVDFGAASPGEDVEAVIEAGSKSFSFPAHVFADSDEFAGIRFQIGRKSPVWSALRSAPQPRFGIEGSTNMSVASADGAEDAITDFAANCLGDAAASTRVIALPKAAVEPAADSFACDDGSTIAIAIGELLTRVANVSLASGQSLTLTATKAPFGEKYTDGGTTLRVSGPNAQLTTPEGNQLCHQR